VTSGRKTKAKARNVMRLFIDPRRGDI